MKRIMILLFALLLLTLSAMAQETVLSTTVPSQHTVTVNVSTGGKVKVSAAGEAGTTLTGNNNSVVSNRHSTVTFEIEPDSDYEVRSASISSAQGVSQDGNRIIISSIAEDRTLSVTFADPSARLPGDVNGDGVVNGKDAIRLEKYLVDPSQFIVPANSDVNGDGKINGKDAIRLEKYLVGDAELQ